MFSLTVPCTVKPMAEHILYRIFDSSEQLLYVGASLHIFQRISSHRKNILWWKDATTIRMERFDSEQELLDAEVMAIQFERPLHNVIYRGFRHKPGRPKRAKGDGAIFQRKTDGMWVGSIEDGYNAEGKRRQKRVYGKDRETVERKLALIQERISNGVQAEGGEEASPSR
ncbi:endonuclease [Mycobacterium phage ThetaBob]|uniref:G-I-Y Y-I-G endonuclease n=1 Tax=Mycobacterium phage ThetaBob TaxID=2588513 RepID=A0A4Y6EWW2_9CAUD|nr:endonuclease [Mycobacterium phage ThetaBob]QDF19934.1 G-I-Y Y-I-G endonuclease [Mycobacterium phage ThetaBob]